MVSSLVRRSRVLRRIDARRRLWRGGLFAPHRFHYFGEFGCLNFFVLGGLQRLFRDSPGVRLEVMTFPLYGELLDGLFPANIRCRTIEYPFREALRQGHRTLDPELTRRVGQLGYGRPLHKLFKSCRHDGFVYAPHYSYLNAREPLARPLPVGAAGRFVSIFPRGRTLEAVKNLTADEWRAVVRVVEAHCPYPIVVHGVAAESVGLPANPRFVFPRGPLEQVAYLNRSACLLSPDSGMVQFAMNCRCDTLVLGGARGFGPYLAYNPFGRRLGLTSHAPELLLPRVEQFVKESMESMAIDTRAR